MGFFDGIFGIFDFILKPLDKIMEYGLRPVDYLEERPVFTIFLLIMIGLLIGGGIYVWNKYDVGGVISDLYNKYIGIGTAKPEPGSSADESGITGTTVELHEHNKGFCGISSCEPMF